MKKNDPMIEVLNAYVDGELSPQEAAHVADQIASDPELSRVVAQLHSVKSAVSASFKCSPDIMFVDQTPSRRVANVASIAVAIAIGVFVLAAWVSQNQNSKNVLLSEALLKHDDWLAESLSQVALSKISSRLVIPDLTPAGLKLAAFEPSVKLGKKTASRFAFVGKRGCQLSLFLIRGNDIILPEAGWKPDDSLAEFWSIGDRTFLLVSRKMNKKRFHVIAKALKSSTMQAIPIDKKMRLALANARQPCRT